MIRLWLTYVCPKVRHQVNECYTFSTTGEAFVWLKAQTLPITAASLYEGEELIAHAIG